MHFMKSMIKAFFQKISPVNKVQHKIVKYIEKKKTIPMFWAVYLRDYYATKYLIEIGFDSEIGLPISFPHPRNITIGEKAIIGGCHIGNDVIIGTGSVVTHDIEDNAIVAGNPCRVIGINKKMYIDYK